MTNLKKLIYLVMTIFSVALLVACMKFFTIITQLSDRIAFFATLIAIVAGVIAYITYSSIDSVKAFTNMDGNVLESENYTNVYSGMLLKLSKAKNSEEYNEILGEIISKKERINDCIEFSIYIQHFIDNIIWLNFCDKHGGILNDYNIQHQCKKKIIKLAKKAKKYEKANKGLENVFDEHIKLIVSILKMHFGDNYLKAKKSNKKDLLHWYNEIISKRYLMMKDKSYIEPIYNVCGQIFVNPITKVTFYNYLGNKFAEETIGLKFYNKDALCIDDMCRIFDSREKAKNRKTALLGKSIENMTYVKAISSKNMLWNCLCSESLLNIKIVEWLISGADSEKCSKIYETIKQVRNAWENMYYVFSAIVTDYENSYIMSTFEKKIHNMDSTELAIKEFNKLRREEVDISK